MSLQLPVTWNHWTNKVGNLLVNPVNVVMESTKKMLQKLFNHSLEVLLKLFAMQYRSAQTECA